MSLEGTKCTRLVLIFCNVIFSWISGGLLVVFGGASLYDPSYIQFHTLLTLDHVPQYVFILFALCIIALGGFIITLGLFGCFGLLCDNNCMVKTYIYFLMFVCIAEIGLAVGSLYLYFTFPMMSPMLRISLVDKMKSEFGYPNHHSFNNAVEFTQATLHCCGMNNSSDFENSQWSAMAANFHLRYPLTCCSMTPISQAIYEWNVTDSEENREEFIVSTESIEVDWSKRCQSLNPMLSDEYLFAQGCWNPLEEIYTRHALFSGILFASLALLQILGVIFPLCWLRRVEKTQQKQIRIRTSRQTQPLL